MRRDSRRVRVAQVGLVALLVLAGAGLASAQGKAVGRVVGKVVDVDGNPVGGVDVTVTCTDLPSYTLKGKTNKKGKFLFSHVDGTKVYQYRFAKEGYQPMVQNVKPVIGDVLSLDFVLQPPQPQSAEGAPGQSGRMGTGDRAILTYNEGAEAQQAGDLETAAKRFAEALAIDPTLAPAQAALAAIAYLKGDYAEAATLAEKALELDPADARALQIRYDAYRDAGDTAKAEEAAAALRAAGGSADAARRVFNQGAEAYNAGDVATAKARFEEAANLDPTLVRADIILSGISLKQGDAKAAATWAAKALEQDPDSSDALKLAYDSARQLGDAEGVQKALDRLVEVDPEWAATGLYEHAVELFNKGDQAGAAAALEEVLKVRPDHAKAHYWLGMSLFNTGQAGPAREHLQRFLELAPDDPDAALAKEILSYAQ